MTITSNDIVFVYSGGLNNANSNESIGGPPSINTISAINNSLFSDVTKTEASLGKIDYRCFYIFNNNSISYLYNSSIRIYSEIEGSSNIMLGVSRTSDVQILELRAEPTSGDFKLKYGIYTTSPISWDSDASILTQNIKSALDNLSPIDDVVVQQIDSKNYSITFPIGRNYELMTVADNFLYPAIGMSVYKQSEGQPINSIAPRIPTEETIPFGVSFSNAINLGNIGPGEGIPVWIKRTTSGSVVNNQQNGFTLRLIGSLTSPPPPPFVVDNSCFYYE
jgi:hypothetical protein